MPYRTKLSFCLAILSIGIFLYGFAESGKSQKILSTSAPIKDAFVLEFKEPYEKLSVDVGDNTITTGETLTIDITPQTVFIDKKKKPVDKKLIRPGVKLEILGNKVSTSVTAASIMVITNLDNWEVNLEGYFEELNENKDIAIIDGQKVSLENKAKIKGEDEWKSLSFTSFDDMQLGAEVRVKGIRKSDGIVYANTVTTKPNDFSKNEKALRLKLNQNLGLTGIEVDAGAVKKLSNGTAVIGGQKFKLVEDLAVQTYVNKVGFKLVPRYIKDLDRNDPSKISFRFYVVEDETINAFAFADGSVFIHTGLLKILKTEAQLAGVIGHEMAHATHEHSRKSIDSVFSKTKTILQNNVLQDDSLITFGLGIFANKFSRDMENQADRVGLRYMYDAGYDPREVPKIWRELDRLTNAAASEPKLTDKGKSIGISDILPKKSKASIENFLYSSHPEAVARLKNLNREIAYNYYDTEFGQTKVKTDEYRQALGYYFGWIKKPVRPQTPGKQVTKPAKTKPKKP
jgi:hypothetical protein